MESLKCFLLRCDWHAAAKSHQLCPTLCNSIDGSPSGSPVPGISRQEHWSGFPFPSPMHACMLSWFSCVQLCATPWAAAHQAPLFLGFSRQEHWSGLPLPSPTCYLDSSKKWKRPGGGLVTKACPTLVHMHIEKLPQAAMICSQHNGARFLM